VPREYPKNCSRAPLRISYGLSRRAVGVGAMMSCNVLHLGMAGLEDLCFLMHSDVLQHHFAI